jgi:hypothetical protein
MFLGLLDTSVELSNKGRREYGSYISYLWRIVFAHISKESVLNDYANLELLEEWYAQNKDKGELNWIDHQIEETRVKYVNISGRLSLNTIVVSKEENGN